MTKDKVDVFVILDEAEVELGGAPAILLLQAEAPRITIDGNNIYITGRSEITLSAGPVPLVLNGAPRRIRASGGASIPSQTASTRVDSVTGGSPQPRRRGAPRASGSALL